MRRHKTVRLNPSIPRWVLRNPAGGVDIPEQIREAQNAAHDAYSLAHDQATAVIARLEKELGDLFRAAMRGSGIEVETVRFWHDRRWDLADWFMSASLVITPELDDDEASEVIEDRTGILLRGTDSITRGGYSRHRPRVWVVDKKRVADGFVP